MTKEAKVHRHFDIAGQEIHVGSIVVYVPSNQDVRCPKFGIVEQLTFCGQELEEYATLRVRSTELRDDRWVPIKAGTISYPGRVLVVSDRQVPERAGEVLRKENRPVERCAWGEWS